MTGDDDIVTERELAEWVRCGFCEYDQRHVRLIATIRELRSLLDNHQCHNADTTTCDGCHEWEEHCGWCDRCSKCGHAADCRLARAIGADRG